MSIPLRVALVGDHHPDIPAHAALPQALALAAHDTGCQFQWIPTDAPELSAQPAHTLASFTGIWCVPGSPYASMRGALHAITFARPPSWEPAAVASTR